jgi:hypothetical protein
MFVCLALIIATATLLSCGEWLDKHGVPCATDEDCFTGFSCDPVEQICVPDLSGDDDSAGDDDAGDDDAGDDDAGDDDAGDDDAGDDDAGDDDTASGTDADGDGVTVEAGDCDDSAANIYPGAPELWGDGIDQDCDGIADVAGASCVASFVVDLPDGSSVTLDGCQSWSLEPAFEFGPADPPQVRSFTLNFAATTLKGFECAVVIVQDPVCGIGYYDAAASANMTTYSLMGCSGVAAPYQQSYTASTGYLRVDTLDAGQVPGNFTQLPLATTIEGYVSVADATGVSLSGNFSLSLEQIVTDEEQQTSCTVSDGDQDDDGAIDLYYGGVDCDDQDPLNFGGNPEVCDGQDNDCDLDADEGLPPGCDADGDLLSSAEELAFGTDPLLADSDADGVDDLEELALGTDPNDPLDSPSNNGDLIFLLGPGATVTPAEHILSTDSTPQELDVYFLFDITCSMGAEISAMHTAVLDIIDTLTCESSGLTCAADFECAAGEVCSLDGQCIEDPASNGCVPSFFSGVGDYRDPGYPIRNLAAMSGDSATTAAAMPGGTGGGGAENLFEAAYCMASPSQCNSSQIEGCAASGIGCPGFRSESVRVLVLITDEDDQANNSYTATSAGSQLAAEGIHFLGIDCDASHMGLADLQAVATAAGSIDSNGQPFVRSGDNAAVVPVVTSALQEILGAGAHEVTIELSEVPGDDGDALPYVDHIEVRPGIDLDGDGTPDCATGLTTTDSNADGFDDVYEDANAGLGLCWALMANATAAPVYTGSIQTMRLQVTVRGDGAIIDQITAFFIIPPGPTF